MPVKIKCQCGQHFPAKERLAGRTVKCPECDRQEARRALYRKPVRVCSSDNVLRAFRGPIRWTAGGPIAPTIGVPQAQEAFVRWSSCQ